MATWVGVRVGCPESTLGKPKNVTSAASNTVPCQNGTRKSHHSARAEMLTFMTHSRQVDCIRVMNFTHLCWQMI